MEITAGAEALRPERAWHVAKRETNMAGGRAMHEVGNEGEAVLLTACFSE